MTTKNSNINQINQILMLKNTSLTQKIKVHLAGIGGVSMYSLAIFLINNGFCVSGSDISNSQNVKNLKKLGVIVYSNHSKQNIKDCDVVVYSNAVETCEEVVFAKKQGKIVVSRSKLLGQILKEYKSPICVAGAHGKTTTTALIYHILKFANKQPSLHLGGNLIESKQCFDYNNGEHMVCEACEYKNSFLDLQAGIGVVLNLANEHLDFFKNFQNIKNSFAKFCKNSKKVVIFEGSQITNDVIKTKGKKNVTTFGFEHGDFIAKNIIFIDGEYTFDCFKYGKFFAKIKTRLVGEHNILNCLASIAVCDMLGVGKDQIALAIQNFLGVERRFEYLDKSKMLVFDYAHHPDEISATLKEFFKLVKSKNKNQKTLVVFQPHTYSRTKSLMSDFKKCFATCQDIAILKTYSAREKYFKSGSARTLAKNLGANAVYLPDKKSARAYILKKIYTGYAVLFLGAGDIYSQAKNIIKLC
ncbi:MAG: UDP-N-acetylmuramate--L-alanine ligase [Clostridiales bacterium]|nr:UDP-N-acetylmuramate--L-alanine ligase [Clostridiales bacterium]